MFSSTIFSSTSDIIADSSSTHHGHEAGINNSSRQQDVSSTPASNSLNSFGNYLHMDHEGFGERVISESPLPPLDSTIVQENSTRYDRTTTDANSHTYYGDMNNRLAEMNAAAHSGSNRSSQDSGPIEDEWRDPDTIPKQSPVVEEQDEPDYIKRYRSSLASSMQSSPQLSPTFSHESLHQQQQRQLQQHHQHQQIPQQMAETTKIDVWEAMKDVNLYKIRFAIEQQGVDPAIQDEEGRTVSKDFGRCRHCFLTKILTLYSCLQLRSSTTMLPFSPHPPTSRF